MKCLNRSNLHPYQRRAIDFICERRHCALFLDMGLGKTVSTLTAVNDLTNAGVIDKVLVIAPLRVANSVWPQEVKRWTHLDGLRITVCTGTEAQRTRALKSKADVYVINRENVLWLRRWLKEKKIKWPFNGLVIDESSSFKNHSAKRFKALKKISANHVITVLLSGTPAPNTLINLWTQMYLVDAGESLGKTLTGFRKRFFTPDYFGYTWTIKEGADKTIHALIDNKVLSMQAKDYLQLPRRINIVERVALPDAVLRQYKKFKRDFLMELRIGTGPGVEITAINAAVLANKLLQFSNGAIYSDDEIAVARHDRQWTAIHNAKLDALGEIIADNRGENIIVVYNYRHDLARLRKTFPDAKVLDSRDDEALIEDWNAGKIKLLLVHPAACGHGINLQYGGSLIVWFGLNWSLELDMQMNARVDRQGQVKPVRIVRIVCKNTIDERVLKVLTAKERTQAVLLNALREELE